MKNMDDVDTVSEGKPFGESCARLFVKEGGQERAYHLDSTIFQVGRDSGSDLVIRDPRVSRIHCEISVTPRGIHVKNVSGNGTRYVQADVVEAFFRSRAFLQVGDVRIELHPGPAAAPLPYKKDSFGDLVGGSAVMQLLFEALRRYASTDLAVLLTGETGTGKELAARAIHEASPRAGKPFVVIDCATINPNLAESALFGHERGAFTGATERRTSPFVLADGGTVFLDELGELPLEVQAKLLRVLETKRLKPLGSNREIQVDVRIIAATCRDMANAINQDAFRQDLYYRLGEKRIALPPLRAHTEDIPLLVERILEADRCGALSSRVCGRSLEYLQALDWRGNVRELRSVVKRAVTIANGATIDLTKGLEGSDPSYDRPLVTTLAAHEEAARAEYVARLYAAANGDFNEMVRLANVDPRTLQRLLDRLGIRRKGGRNGG